MGMKLTLKNVRIWNFTLSFTDLCLTGNLDFWGLTAPYVEAVPRFRSALGLRMVTGVNSEILEQPQYTRRLQT
jgi:hypothetical protein